MKNTVSIISFLIIIQAETYSQTYLGNYTSHNVSGKVITVQADTSLVKFIFYKQDVLRVDFLPSPASATDSTFVVIRDTAENVSTNINESDSLLEISSSTIRITCKKFPLRITYSNTSGKILLTEPVSGGLATNNSERSVVFSINMNERFYGTGERGIGLDLRGKSFDSYNTQIGGYTTPLPTMNINVPFLLSTNGYGLFFDNTYKGRFDLGNSDPTKFSYTASSGELTYYLIAAPTIPEQLELYTWLTGRQPLPPKWAFGFIQSKFGYQNEIEARGIVQTMRQKQIPCDALVLDLYWYQNMGDLSWNLSAFPNPSQMVDDFLSNGIKTILITQTYFTQYSNNWSLSSSLKFFVKNSSGETYIIPNWWSCGCNASLLDITNPYARNWFWGLHPQFLGNNVAGLWTDLGEPELHNSDMFHYLGTAGKIHNVYNLLWSKMIFDGLSIFRPNQRLFNLTRSGFAGIQRYGVITWSGDVGKSFGGLAIQIPMLLNMGMSGLAYHNSDIGGFCCGTTTPELYVRWMQYGTFCPVTRAHGVGQPTEPWGFGAEAENISKKFIELRYQLLPYIYTMAYENYKTGLPLARPLLFDNPNDVNLQNESASYLWGNKFLVSPVVQAGQINKNVYLPSGKWVDFWTDQMFTGGQSVNVSAPLEKMPLFVKSGSIIPMQPIMNYADERPLDTLFLNIYPLKETISEFTLYEDDGKTLDYQSGSFAQTTFTQNVADSTININIGASVGNYTGKVAQRVYISDIHNIVEKPDNVLLNDQLLLERNSYNDLRQNGNGYYYDTSKSRLYIQALTNADSNYLLTASNIKLTDVHGVDLRLHESYNIEQNYPNPFNSSTTIRYQIPGNSRVKIKIFNLLGQEVKLIFDGIQPAGYKSVIWDSKNNSGASVASGIYLYKIKVIDVADPGKTFSRIHKMVLMK